MADIYNKSKRSHIMAKISGKETKPEILVRKFLYRKGFRYRKNDKRLPGKPDVVLPRYQTAIFVHGCFWHGHRCKAGKLPETRKEFWTKKIEDTKIRDKKNQKELKHLGWKIIIVWQCELKNKAIRETKLLELINEISN
ncbi:DNA mismatch endonuclease Vsr [Fulvivirgaceae bacterium BMA10]|uniref:Very short patch repair endonuclease n=1 Tax=Splendidivirga corallicola TaxID=3051826 RepID=A0ABT8KUV5_9BACT|nr:DNA mismatch endonuclease Vsr [Fulvivirgaceae bacterium BMA10]